MKANSTYRTLPGRVVKTLLVAPHVCGHGFRDEIIMTPSNKVYDSVLCLDLLQHVLIKLSFKSYDVVAHYVHRRLEKLCPCATFLPWTSSSNIGLSSILTYDTMSVGMQLQFHSNMTAASTGTDDHRSTGAQEHRSTGAQEHRTAPPDPISRHRHKGRQHTPSSLERRLASPHETKPRDALCCTWSSCDQPWHQSVLVRL